MDTSKNKPLAALALVLSSSGYALVIVFANWKVALGVLVLMWANNIERGYK